MQVVGRCLPGWQRDKMERGTLIRFLVLAGVLALAGVCSAGEFLVDTVANYKSEPATQEYAALAFGSSSYLAVWLDARSGSGLDLYAARMSPAGSVFDSAGIPITTSSSLGEVRPDIACDGANFLAVWEDCRGGGPEIYGARIARSGAVLDSSGICIAGGPKQYVNPAVAFGESCYFVVWQDYHNGTPDICGERIACDGSLPDTMVITIASDSESQTVPAVAFDGTNFLVVWQAAGMDTSILGARVSATGQVLDSVGLVIAGAPARPSRPRVSFNGGEYLVVWQDGRSDSADVFGARVLGNGTLLDPLGLPIASGAGNQRTPAIARCGANWLVTWCETGSDTMPAIRAARVSTDGQVLDPSGIDLLATDYGRHSPAVGFDGTNALVAWHGGSTESDIRGCRVTQSGTVSDSGPILISLSAESGVFSGGGVRWHELPVRVV